jgi:hypothetical protein
VLQQHGAEAASLVRVADVERHLGVVGVQPLVAADPDDVLAEGDHERDPVPVVDVGEPVQVGLRQPGQRREEPEVDRLGRLLRVEPLDRGRILRGDPAQVRGPPVTQCHIGFPGRHLTRLRRSPDLAGVRQVSAPGVDP